MTSKFLAAGGVDLDTLFELAPNESYSIWGSINGYLVEPPNTTATTISSTQFVTDNGVTDLLKRYLYQGYGTPSSSGSGFFLLVNTYNSDTGYHGTATIDMKDVAAAKGSGGGVPTWAASTSTAQMTRRYTSGSGGDTVTSNYTANGGGFPITAYNIVSSSIGSTSNPFNDIIVNTSEISVDSSGKVSINFQAFTRSSTHTNLTVTVVVSATNIYGVSSTNHTHIITITVYK